MRARYLIIDAHSVIFAWPELRKLHRRRMALARDELIKSLTAYQDASGVSVVVVFDGQGAKVSDESTPGGIQIVYADSSHTADDIIEKLVARYSKKFQITVATGDSHERQTVTSFGGDYISASSLRVMLQDAENDLARRINAWRKR